MARIRSFSLVDNKVAEAEFFLDLLSGCGADMFAMRCYCSAFVSSTRSITFALQAVLGSLDGFSDWYVRHQNALRSDATARFFHEFRTANQHIGDNVVAAGTSAPSNPFQYFFVPSSDLPEAPHIPVVEACASYFRTILRIIFDCYLHYGPAINAHQRYTAEFFASIGKFIEDAEEELGFPRGYTDIGDPAGLPYRWELLRRQVPGCEIESIFEKYLQQSVPKPEKLPPYVPLVRR